MFYADFEEKRLKEKKCFNGVQINKIINGRGNGSVLNVLHYYFMGISESCVDVNFMQTSGSTTFASSFDFIKYSSLLFSLQTSKYFQ